MRIRNEERGSGTKNKDPEQGKRIRNEGRNTLRLCINSVMICGERGPAMCAHGGTSDPLFRFFK